jgi:trans-aconitate 2-methyltransferase
MEAQRRWDAATYHRASDVQEARAEELLEHLHLRGDETVLDAGCGSGRATERLLERLPRGRVIAVDFSPAMVEHARATLGDRATVLHSDLTELELEQPVDVVFSNAVFHWVLDQDLLYARMFALLRPGGTLLASCGGTGNLDGFLEIAAGVSAVAPFDRYLAGYTPGWRFPGAEETEVRLRAAGFADVRASLDSVVEFPLDPGGYARTAPLLCHLELLPRELHDDFVAEVIRRCGSPMQIDHVRLRIEARRPGRTD